MSNLTLSPRSFIFVVATRIALAFGAGLLVADRIPVRRRRAIAATLISLGAVTTIPAARLVLRSRANKNVEL